VCFFFVNAEYPSITTFLEQTFFRTEQYSNFEDPFLLSSINMTIIFFVNKLKVRRVNYRKPYGELTQIQTRTEQICFFFVVKILRTSVGVLDAKNRKNRKNRENR